MIAASRKYRAMSPEWCEQALRIRSDEFFKDEEEVGEVREESMSELITNYALWAVDGYLEKGKSPSELVRIIDDAMPVMDALLKRSKSVPLTTREEIRRLQEKRDELIRMDAAREITEPVAKATPDVESPAPARRRLFGWLRA